MCLLGMAAVLIISLLVVGIECWIFYHSVAVPFGYTADGLVSQLFSLIILLPTILLTVSGCIYLAGKIDKFLDKGF